VFDLIDQYYVLLILIYIHCYYLLSLPLCDLSHSYTNRHVAFHYKVGEGSSKYCTQLHCLLYIVFLTIQVRLEVTSLL